MARVRDTRWVSPDLTWRDLIEEARLLAEGEHPTGLVTCSMTRPFMKPFTVDGPGFEATSRTHRYYMADRAVPRIDFEPLPGYTPPSLEPAPKRDSKRAVKVRVGTLRQRPNGHWQSQARLPATGRLTAKTWKTTSQSEARKLHAQWIADVIGGREGAAGPTLKAHIDAWMLRQAHRPAATLVVYRTAARRVTDRIGRLRLRDITPRVCDDLLAELAATYAASSVQTSRSVLGQALRWAVVRGELGRDPLIGITVTMRPAKQRLAATLEQVEAIIAAEPNQMWRTFWLTLAGTGARQGEVCALQWGDIDWDEKTIRIQRTMTVDARNRRTVGTTTKNTLGVRAIPVRQTVLDGLRSWRVTMSESVGLAAVRADAPVFVGPMSGRAVTASSVQARWRKALEAAEITAPITPHSVRHWAASSMLRAGMDPHIVARGLGHTVSELMETYGGDIPADAGRRALEGLPDVGAGLP